MALFFQNREVSSISQAISHVVDDVTYFHSAYENAQAERRKMDDMFTTLMEKLYGKGVISEADVVEILDCNKLTTKTPA
jgi:hypothetical protein